VTKQGEKLPVVEKAKGEPENNNTHTSLEEREPTQKFKMDARDTEGSGEPSEGR